jgi:penicillin-binding protein 1C
MPSYQYRSVRLRRGLPYKIRLIRLKILNNLPKIAIVSTIGLFIMSFVLFVWLSKDLPLPDKVQRKEGFSTVISDRNGKPLYDIYSEKNRIPVPLTDMPETLKKATIAVEDKEFYKHQGFDPKGILRAFFHIVTFSGIQGGSTLTQQLVKNVLLTTEQTIPRKIKEFVLAIQIEKKYSKDEILQMYLNEAPYGGTMWGIEAASLGYFNKHTKELTDLESIILAGFPQRPSYYSPYSGNNKAYIKRSEEVLRRMREDGFITVDQEYSYKKQLPNFQFATASSSFRAPHFVLNIKKQLTEMFGDAVVEKGGLKITTTLDRDLQDKAESIVKEELEKLKSLKVSNGAVVVINPQTGEVLGYIGSKDYNSEDPKFEGKFDVVSMGYRQPGSALKPITYAVGFMKGYTPASLLMDVETHFPAGKDKPDYIPKNYDNKFRGPIQVRYALANSVNIPAVKMTALVGIRDILKTANEMGLISLASTDENINRLGLSLTLGGGEVRLFDLVSAYGVFATEGVKNEIYSIQKVVDNSGKTIYEHKSVSGKRVLPEDVSYLISHILLDNNSRKEIFGENSYLVIPGKTVSVKTGTTDDKRDNWTVGYTPNIVVGVWVGNNDNSPMDPKLASGVTGAAPIWNRIIREALKNLPDTPPKKPDSIISLDIDAYSGGLPYEGKPIRNEYFIKGTEPASSSPIYQKIKVSKSDNNKLANQVEIATGAYDEKNYIIFKENDPTNLSGKNMWQEGIDKWLEGQGDSLYHPPKDTSTTNENSVIVRIKSPSDMSQTDNNSVEVNAEAKAAKDIKKMELYVDDYLKNTFNANSFNQKLNLDTGIHKIKVKAFNSSDNTGESEIKIGVKVSPNETPTSVPQHTLIPTNIPTIVLSPIPTPS